MELWTRKAGKRGDPLIVRAENTAGAGPLVAIDARQTPARTVLYLERPQARALALALLAASEHLDAGRVGEVDGARASELADAASTRLRDLATSLAGER